MFLGLFFMMIIVILFVLAIGSSIIQGVLDLIFGLFGRRATTSQQRYGDTRQSQQQTRQQSQSQPSTNSKKSGKIFDKSDGEYIDFEEIKE